MKLIWCKQRRAFVEPSQVRRDPVARSDLPAPMVRTDHMDMLWHPATGLYSDSKAAFRRMTRESGCIEVGDEAPTTPGKGRQRPERQEQAERVQAIKGAMRQHGMDVL